MKKILLITTIVATLFSCSEDERLANDDIASGPKVVGFEKSFEAVSYFSDEGQVEIEFPIVLLGLGDGNTLSSDIVINYEIDAANSTATEGVEFNFANSTNQVTLKAGSNYTTFPLKVNTGQLNPTMKTKLVVKLSEASNSTVISENDKSLEVVFVGCLSNLLGNYSALITWNNGAASGTRGDEVLSSTGINTFRTKYVGGWAFGTFTPPGYEFIDICGEISLTPAQRLGQYSNQIVPVTTDNVPNDGEVTSATEFYTVYNIVPYPGENNRVYKTFYTKL
jgi:hypothetical protein